MSSPSVVAADFCSESQLDQAISPTEMEIENLRRLVIPSSIKFENSLQGLVDAG